MRFSNLTHLRALAIAVVVLVGETGCYGYGRGGVVGGTTYSNTYTQTVATFAGNPSREVATFAFSQELTYLLGGGEPYGSNTVVDITNVAGNGAPLCFNYTGTATLNLRQYFFTGTVNNLYSGQTVQREVGTNPMRIDLAQITILFTSDSHSVPGTAFCN